MAYKKTIHGESGTGEFRTCPRCGGVKLRSWGELSEDERFIAVRRDGSAGAERRVSDQYCSRCFTRIPEPRTSEA